MMELSTRQLLRPGQAEIIRAWQKDGEFIKRLNSEVEEVVQGIWGQRTSQKWRKDLKGVCTALYLSLTNLAGYQTLGEEYCGIVMTDGNKAKIPGTMKLTAFILLTTYGYSTMEYVISLVEQYFSRLKGDEVNLVGDGATKALKHYLPFLQQLHLAWFYGQGLYYHVAKRVLDIQYLLVRRSFANQDSSSQRMLKHLMWISLINSLITFASDTYSLMKSLQNKKDESPDDHLIGESLANRRPVDPNTSCTLCLDQRKNTSLTPCGHLFCWDCIMDWLRSKLECPICREQLSPSRIVPLQNYS